MQVQTVETSRQWRTFIDLPWSIYAGNRHWVPPLRIAVRGVLNTRRNPFFRHAALYPLLAYQDGKAVGRIAGIADEAHNAYHAERTAFFGFFECVNDQSVCDAMLNAVSDWARGQGMHLLRGPVNPSTNHECGLLVEGFDKRPRFMMTYNPPYYPGLLTAHGLTKAKDLTAWDTEATSVFSDRFTRIADRQRQRAHITVRDLRMRDFDREIEVIREIYNNAWGENWGFVPMDEIEFRYMAKQMRMVLDPRLCLIAYVRDEPAAFALALPNINQVLMKIRNGRLLPYGIFVLGWYLLGPGRRSAITECRILTLGIRQKYRTLGLGSLLYFEYLTRAPAAGMGVAEASWILEDNADMIATLESSHARITRRYRIYDKPLR